MVDKLNAILSIIERDKGPVSLFAAAKMDELTDRWTIILSAEWAKDAERETFEYLIGILIEKLSPELGSVARVGVYTPDEHLIEDLLKFKKGSHLTESIQANGNTIHEAYIIESKTPKS
jgi:hypothetical protein